MELDRCHFWLARFHDREQIDAYLREEYGDDDKPISRFAADQGEKFYDHDWAFVESSDNGSLEELLAKAKVIEATAQILREFALRHGLQVNAILVADQNGFKNSVSVAKDAYRLDYVGCYALWREGVQP